MKPSTASFYNRISFLYPLINYFLQKQRKILIREVNTAAPGKLLEIGVGNGTHLPLYAGHEITGIDISEAMLHKASQYRNEQTRLLLMNGEDMKFDDASFDYVVMSHVLAVVKNPDQLLAQAHRVLKPGGRLYILNHFTPDNWLKYADRAFQPLSSILHFRSAFYVNKVKGLQQFLLVRQKELGAFAYFKLLILSKT